MRDAISVEEADEVLAVLAVAKVRVPTNWSRRFKNHQEKLKSGDVYECAEVVRNLTRREQSGSLSTAEKSMHARARHILVSELSVSWGIDPEAAEAASTACWPRPRPDPPSARPVDHGPGHVEDVGDDPVDPEVDQGPHPLGIVHGPHVDRQAQRRGPRPSGRLVDQDVVGVDGHVSGRRGPLDAARRGRGRWP